MDEENSLDFKALRAKFQEEEELLLKQPLKSKPVLPEKPKVVPPPQSPTNYMPAGARPSLLSTINQSLEGKTTVAPRVVFKDEKKESKKPLFPSNSKISKVKVSKDKGSKGSRERLYDEDVPPQKTKKEKKKEATAELVPATPPPKNTTLKKKGFFFKKSKRDSLEITGDPIMDSPSSEVVGPIPLIPVPEDFPSSPTEASTPKALIPTSGPTAVTLPLSISTSSDLTPAPAFSTEALSLPFAPTLESETTAPIDTAHLAHPPNLNDLPVVLTPLLITPDPEVTVPTPTLSNPSPEPELSIEDLNALDIPSPSVDVDSISASPKLERPLSALSALSVLERAEEMNPGKRTPPGDSRIFNALEKARKMAHNHHKPASPLLMSPSAEDRPVLLDLPPIDYEGKMGQDLPPKPEMNGLDHRSSLVFKELTEDDFLDPSEVPPPPPRRPLSEFEIAAPPKPERPHSVDLSAFSPPPLEDSALAIPAPADFFSESDSGAQLEFGDVTPKVHSPELPVSDWGSGDNDGSGTITKDGPYLPNGTIPTGEVQVTTPELHDSPENSLILTPGSHGDDNPYEHADSAYDDVSTLSKKKGKGDVKKRKGQPKNPYAETQELKTEEKTKTGRFGKSDKKAAAEGPDEKELKKKEKQRMEKEKKERQEREKKEQKEREKRENELKKKFKITGQEDAMYQAKVTVTTKGRKQDLPVKSGDTISIIRTTNCPKGKWLARDGSNNYGYVAVDHLDLDIKEMLELGKKAAESRLNSTYVEPEVPSAGAPNHYPNESFTDDSEEWTCDDDEPLSPTDHIEAQLPVVHSRAHSLPVMGDKVSVHPGSEVLSINHQHSHSDLADGPNQQARHEALQKLATFFHPVKTTESPASPVEPASSPEVIMEEESVPESSPPQEQEFQIPIIPPPEQYADFQTE